MILGIQNAVRLTKFGGFLTRQKQKTIGRNPISAYIDYV